MEWVETTGRSVEEAKEAALDQLGVDESDAEFVVLSEPKAGLFGRMRGEARVRARVVPTAPRPKRGRSRRPEERRSRSRSGSGRSGGSSGRGSVAVADADSGGGDSESGSSAAVLEGVAPGTDTATRRRRSRGGRGRGRGASSVSSASQGAAPAGGQSPEEGASEQDRPEVPSTAGGSGQGSRSGRRPRAADTSKEEPVGEVLSLEQQGESAKQFIAGLVQELGLSAEVSLAMVDESTAEVAVTGPELGILVGPGGSTLAALQELARTVVQRHTGGHSERILVDVAGYRARRAEALQRFTRQIADEVISSGAERALEPMSAADRKVVHDAVNEIDGVSTRSEGEEPRRYIVVAPSAGGDIA